MELMIAENLKELRRERGSTQEDLANHCRISVQAISKWERGDGMPDITLLPDIAAFYGTTVDTLLGCDEAKMKNDIDAFNMQCHMLLNKGKNDEKLLLCRDMQKKYPNNEDVLYQLMHALYNIDRKSNFNEIAKTANRLIKSENNQYRFGAIQLLCFTYDANGRNEEAIEFARMIPDNEDLLVHVLKGSELVEHCQWYFWRICDNMQQKLAYLLETPESGYTAAQRHAMREKLYDFYHVIFSDGDFGFWHDRLARLCFAMALSSAESGQSECALDELEEMVEHFKRFAKFVSIDHTSLLVNRIHYEEKQVGRSNAESLEREYLKRMDNERFNVIRNEPKFIAVVEALKRC